MYLVSYQDQNPIYPTHDEIVKIVIKPQYRVWNLYIRYIIIFNKSVWSLNTT
jgi:hypothetical protein